ncbi:MAG: 4Fe-4S dicluster domain-containing protein [Flexistipes sinusarabici]|uniref:4Fe-4S dicluster domain-containing protein n=1 Tax=Flexistipes sinusarabici TaxID=2352 RepID=A0A5D0MH20_FLESI|nr:4Fe-4S dicluster domain-containing protein [Flexistipes sinusarabici]TYB33014.1 MAG: 4Fe-4S dicluster domain-containing protein [Flexistipes sinusarabici]
MGIADKALENLNKNLHVVNHSCLNFRHKNSRCDICMSQCPAGAINITSYRKKITVDWEKCLGCFGCTSVCPTEVFWPKTGEIKTFIENAFARSKNYKYLCISCSIGKKTLNNDWVLHIPSMRMISWIYLLMLTFKSVERIDFVKGDCDTCSIQECSKHLNAEIEKLKHILEIMDKDIPLINILKDEEYSEPEYFKYECRKDSILVSRREMFGLFKKRVKESIGSSFTMLGHNDKQELRIAENYRLPKKRQLLLDLFERINNKRSDLLEKTVDLTALDFAEVAIDGNKCVKCEVCTKICPTGALTANCSDDESKYIAFTPAYCINCGLCEMVCTNNSISRSKPVNLQSIAAKCTTILQT